MKSYEELIKLKEMLDAGVITQEEFAALKKKALEEDDISLKEDVASAAPVASAPNQAPAQTIEIPAAPISATVSSGQEAYDAAKISQLGADLDKWGKISIATIILGLIWGVIALIASSKGKKAFNIGDYVTAESKLKLEKIMLYVAIGVNALFLMLMGLGQ